MKYQAIWATLKRFLSAPTFPDPEQARAARWLNIAVYIIVPSFVFLIASLFVNPVEHDAFNSLLISDIGALAIALFVWFITQRGFVRAA